MRYEPLCVEPLIAPVKHLIYYVMPVGGVQSWIWADNVAQLCKCLHLFNGRKIVTIATSDGRPKYKFDAPYEVIDHFNNCGAEDVEFVLAENSHSLWETQHFINAITKLYTLDPQHVICYGHAKGVTHADPAHIAHEWRRFLYDTVLSNWDQVKVALETYGIAGALKRYGEFKTPYNHQYYYSGTFFWFRCASAFARRWTEIDRVFYGAEAWPAKVFRPQEAACIIGDDIKDLYKYDKSWFADQWYLWDKVKRDNVACFPETVEEYLGQLKDWKVTCKFAKLGKFE